ncbi:cellulose binding domain-containing protein [Sorangium sp. So ce381]|uniref:cellulose binding domain-containing protein n=1 Tax=Sorangium sp. So ce381 TaxID=3133307 RepID=UPI003F5BE044
MQYATRDAAATPAFLSFKVQVKNTGSASVPLQDVTIRYWFTADGFTSALMSNCDFASVTGGRDNIIRTFHEASGTDADHYLEIGFASATGSLAPGATSGYAEIAIYNANYDKLTQANDYSFSATATAFTPSMQVTGYRAGELAWGIEP